MMHAWTTCVHAQEYEAMKAAAPELNSLAYGQMGKVPEANVDKMVAEMHEAWVCAHAFVCVCMDMLQACLLGMSCA